jgi:non-specific serine/threonine protein kinase
MGGTVLRHDAPGDGLKSRLPYTGRLVTTRPAGPRRLTMVALATTFLAVHLPPQPTPLIGREDELAFLRSLLAQDDGRLLTLIGSGGVGKTRLAVAAAAQAAERFPDGVWFVDLAPLADPSLVVPTIARVVGVREQTGQDPLEALATFLGARAVLLVVDNLEHLLPAAADLDALLREGPHLTLLATSREPLRLRRERLFEVYPLQVPAPHPATWTIANLAAMPAVQLFLMRAQAADARFELSPANAEAVAELSRRLEGLPLAVELAAARIRLLEPKVLLARMHQSLALLHWDASDLPPRHRSLHATLDWSYVLLTAHQQALFRRLAIFAGGFTLEGAEAVFAGAVPGADDGAGDGLFYRRPEPPPRSPAALDDLAALVDHSLVRQVAPVGEEPRYRLLETVRAFGLEQLQASGEESEVRRRHLVYFVALAERLAEHVRLTEGEQVLARLDAEHANVRAALAWAEASGEAALGLRLARALFNYWLARGHLREGIGWLERALGWDPTAPSAERARALGGLGWLALFQGDSDRAEAAFGEALCAAVAVRAPLTEAMALTGLALVHLNRGHYEAAAARTDEALALYLDQESAAIAGPTYVSLTYARRGEIALAAGDLAGAARSLKEAERRQRAPGQTWGLSAILRWRGDLARARGDLAGALAHYRESLALAGDSGHRLWQADALEGVAAVAAAWGQPERAARLHGAAAAVREQMGEAVPPWVRPARERDLAAARAALAPDAFDAAWAAGAALPLEAAVAEAIADPRAGLTASGAPPTADPAAALGLTPREVDVLRLLAQGYSNQEIGNALFISKRTASFHVSNLLAKLELESRAAAAAFAVRNGLT